MILQSVNYMKCNHRSGDCRKKLLRWAEHNTTGRYWLKKSKSRKMLGIDDIISKHDKIYRANGCIEWIYLLSLSKTILTGTIA